MTKSEPLGTTSLTIRRPDDWHLHLRDGAVMGAVAPYSYQMGRVLVMPNLVPPVVTTDDMHQYRDRIYETLPSTSEEKRFMPYMTLYLTDDTDPEDVRAANASKMALAVKLYPAGATTNSASGVTDWKKVLPVLEVMAEIGMPLCVHGEVTRPDVDIFDREKVFIDEVLDPMRTQVPRLRVVMEHITTSEAAEYVTCDTSGQLAATITIQHLMLDRNDLLVGGLRPHNYCLPILKRSKHREALVKAATSGDPDFFLGTDSAPHATHKKEAECCAAGCFTAPVAMACLAQAFEDANALDKLEDFTSVFGAQFYGLPVNEDTITLKRSDQAVKLPDAVYYVNAQTGGRNSVTVFNPGRPIHWSVAD